MPPSRHRVRGHGSPGATPQRTCASPGRMDESGEETSTRGCVRMAGRDPVLGRHCNNVHLLYNTPVPGPKAFFNTTFPPQSTSNFHGSHQVQAPPATRPAPRARGVASKMARSISISDLRLAKWVHTSLLRRQATPIPQRTCTSRPVLRTVTTATLSVSLPRPH